MTFQVRDLMINVVPGDGSDVPAWRMCQPVTMFPTTGDDEKAPEGPDCQAISCGDGSGLPEPEEPKKYLDLTALRAELRQALRS